MKQLYWPERPYAFEVVPADILGQIYERFLGRIIYLTPAHRAKADDKPEVKKAGGVYYTPTYVVDYIVKNTVGPFLKDRNWPLAYEPSGEDFLSPGLAEADLLRRVLTEGEFADWLDGFWVDFRGSLQPVISPDPSDPKFSHLDGLNLSRAWMLKGIAAGLPRQDRRTATLRQLEESHTRAGLAAITGEHYVGSHWLGTFAVYLLSDRGIAQPR